MIFGIPSTFEEERIKDNKDVCNFASQLQHHHLFEDNCWDDLDLTSLSMNAGAESEGDTILSGAEINI